MAVAPSTPDLKARVQSYWDTDPCGSRYLQNADDFEIHARVRYALEPHIPQFAGFSEAREKRVLEIGVGMGADYLEWLKAGAKATGIDFSSVSLEKARRRCQFAGYEPDLHLGDAEHLPFLDQSFDLVYSYGVMHHSPDTAACLREAWRVLKPGGQARIMVYHHPSMVGLMLWLRYGMFRGKSLRQSVFDHLESPGTKSYTKQEIRSLMSGFERIECSQVFSPGDLLVNEPSARFQGSIYRVLWTLYPRWAVRWFCRKFGLFVLISAKKGSL